MSSQHKLKTWKSFFDDIRLHRKSFELRKNDRNFEVGDVLVLQEYDKEKEQYTGREIHRVITYMLEGFDGLMHGFVILEIKPV